MAFSQHDRERYMHLSSDIIAFSAFTIPMTTIATFLRVYTRLKVVRSFVMEDWAMCFAWSGSVVYATLGLQALRYAPVYGNAPTEHNIRKSNQIAWGLVIIYSPAITATKLSILLRLMRIFAPIPGSRRRTAILAFLWLNILWFVPVFLLSIFQCMPIGTVWNPTIKEACINYPVFALITVIFNVVSDWILLMIPMILIWKLHLSSKRKLGVAAVFLMGILGCITSVVRLAYNVIYMKNIYAHDSLTAVFLCALAEIVSGSLCGNLPNLPALVRHIREKTNHIGLSQVEPKVNNIAGKGHDPFNIKDIGSLIHSTSDDNSVILGNMNPRPRKDNEDSISSHIQEAHYTV